MFVCSIRFLQNDLRLSIAWRAARRGRRTPPLARPVGRGRQAHPHERRANDTGSGPRPQCAAAAPAVS